MPVTMDGSGNLCFWCHGKKGLMRVNVPGRIVCTRKGPQFDWARDGALCR